MSARYAVDELVDVHIKGARVAFVETGTDTVIVRYPLGTPTTLHDVTLMLSPSVKVSRVAPKEWPPQPDDLWRDSLGGNIWFARAVAEAREIDMVAAAGICPPDKLLAERGPMTLVYREGWTPAPAADVEAGPEQLDERAATIAGLRELADFIEQHPDLPAPVSVEARSCILRDDDEAGLAEVRRVAAVLDVEAKLADDVTHPRARRQFSGDVCFDAYYVTAASRRDFDAKMAAQRAARTAAKDVAPPAGDAVAATVAEAATAPEDGHVYECCGKVGRISRHESWCPTRKAAPDFNLGPVDDETDEHYHVGGAVGGPGENEAECACGVTYAGFDTHTEALVILDAHILGAGRDKDPAVETDPAALDGPGVAVTGEDDLELDRPGYSDKVRTWLFSFGAGQQHDGRYVLIRDTGERARREMIAHFGLEWCEQYRSSSANAAMVRGTCEVLRREDWPPRKAAEPDADGDLIADGEA